MTRPGVCCNAMMRRTIIITDDGPVLQRLWCERCDNQAVESAPSRLVDAPSPKQEPTFGLSKQYA